MHSIFSLVDLLARPSRHEPAPPRDERVLLDRRSRLASLRVTRPLRITCTAGTAWLTSEGDPHDHVLDAGNSHEARAGSAIVVLGMPEASLVLTPLAGRRHAAG